MQLKKKFKDLINNNSITSNELIFSKHLSLSLCDCMCVCVCVSVCMCVDSFCK